MPTRGFIDKTKIQCKHGCFIYVTGCEECKAALRKYREEHPFNDDDYSIPGHRG